MKVLFLGRSTLYSSPGGDTTQIEMTATYLKKLGVDVHIQLSNKKVPQGQFDLIHFFNIIRPDDILPHIHNLEIPFILSTIFVDYSEFEKNQRKGILGFINRLLDKDQIEYVKAIVRAFKNGEKIKSLLYILMGHKSSIKYIIKRTALLLPNSHHEYNRLVHSYSIKQRYRKVVNAIDCKTFNPSVKPNLNFLNHILCIGRIEGLKNQLNLIKAIAGTDLYLTIIGKPSPNHINYYKECVESASGFTNIRILNHVDHKELPSIYKAAKVHVLPSWFETTGLTSLEAGAMGCNVVVTKHGDTEEYFGDLAFYCKPDDICSIREAVLAAYSEPPKPKLQQYILNNYTWRITAEQTLRAYNLILKDSK